MASDHPSASQQPFAHPLPAPVQPAIQAASPPTKQSLKTWWKGFRPPQKAQETPGKSPPHGIMSFVGAKPYYTTTGFVSKLPRDLPPIFQESAMDGATPVVDGLPSGDASPATLVLQHTIDSSISALGCLHSEEVSRASLLPQQSAGSAPSIEGRQPEEASLAPPLLQTNNKCFVLPTFGLPKLLRPNPRPRPGSILGGTNNEDIPDPQIPSTDASAKQRSEHDKEESGSPGGTLSTRHKEASALGRVGRFLWPPRFLSFLNLNPFSREKSPAQKVAKYFKAPGHQGIFGVPLRESITYANVAISLVDAEGKSYIYGYVPIVVAKCGVYLKEKGMGRFLSHVCAQLLILPSHQC